MIIAVCFMAFVANAQSKMGLEQYSYMGTGQVSNLAPVAHFESQHKWYAEVRYNYDNLQTFSVYLGKTFSKERRVSYSLTPRLGVLTGLYNGAAVGLNTEITYKTFTFCSQTQYNISSENVCRNFLFSWSELYCQPADCFFAGLSLQQTQLHRTSMLTEPGLLIGLSFRQFRFPLYAFRPFQSEMYFVAGINWEWKQTAAH
jgi:hypothetical protein